MVTRTSHPVKALGVADDEREEEGKTAKTPRRQKREIGLRSELRIASWVRRSAVRTVARRTLRRSRDVNGARREPPNLILPLLASWRFKTLGECSESFGSTTS